jgi:hypothetical protein
VRTGLTAEQVQSAPTGEDTHLPPDIAIVLRPPAD